MKNCFKTFLAIFVLVFITNCKKQDLPVEKYDLPVIQTLNIDHLINNGISISAKLISDGGAKSITKGICFSTSFLPTVEDNIVVSNDSTSQFSVLIKNLLPNTSYFFRAYATNSEGTSYGDQIQIITNEGRYNSINNLYIGQNYKGGIISYFLQPGDDGYDANVPHGIISSLYDAKEAEWGCSGVDIPNTKTTIGSGSENTKKILAGCGSETAAKYCDEYAIDEFNDWYLPSIDELEKLMRNLYFYNLGEFKKTFYHSSSQYTVYNNHYIDFRLGIVSDGNSSPYGSKDDIYNVRPIRKF
jgi:hypothetical protein